MLLSCTLDSPASRNFDSWGWKIWSIQLQAKIQHVLSVQLCGDFVAVPEVDWLCKPSKREFHGTLGSQLVLMKLHTCTLTDKISAQVASSSLELSGCRQSAFSEIPTCMSKRRVKIEHGDCVGHWRLQASTYCNSTVDSPLLRFSYSQQIKMHEKVNCGEHHSFVPSRLKRMWDWRPGKQVFWGRFNLRKLIEGRDYNGDYNPLYTIIYPKQPRFFSLLVWKWKSHIFNQNRETGEQQNGGNSTENEEIVEVKQVVACPGCRRSHIGLQVRSELSGQPKSTPKP